LRKGWNGLITEIRQNGKSYLLMTASTGANGYLMHKLGVLQPLSNIAFVLRGTGFALQSAFPKKLGPDSAWGERFARFYGWTFIPNVADGTIKMFDPEHYNSLVYVPYGVGVLPFAAGTVHRATTGEAAVAHRGNHLGYAGFTMGSAFYIPESFVPSPLGGWVGPTSAVMFQGGSLMWLGAWIDSRKAGRYAPGTAHSRFEQSLDHLLLDRFAPKYEKARPVIDGIANGFLYGGGLILFGLPGVVTLVDSLIDKIRDDKGASPDDGTGTGTDPTVEPIQGPSPSVTAPPDTPSETPPQTPPVDPPETPQPPERPVRPVVIVERWHSGEGPYDNSTLWNIAGSNFDTLLTPEQKTEARREGLSFTQDRDLLVADWALPRLVDLNPQYRLAANPDLIHPGWRLKVG
jgi:hypothetical protein